MELDISYKDLKALLMTQFKVAAGVAEADNEDTNSERNFCDFY